MLLLHAGCVSSHAKQAAGAFTTDGQPVLNSSSLFMVKKPPAFVMCSACSHNM